MKNVLKIILTTLVVTVCYGIIHDMVTAHLCVEYFTIGHPKIIESESPVKLALAWGIIATWWVALPMGILIAGFNCLGSYPPLEYKQVVRLILRLILMMVGLALLAGITGFILSEMNVIYLVSHLAEQTDKSNHSKFLATGWAHISSYLTGVTGTLFICLIIHQRRRALKT